MAEPITNVLGIVGMENKGAYDADTYYEKLNIVSYQGSSYCALDSVHNVLPTDTTKWQLIAEKGDKGATGQDGYTPVKGTDYYTAEDKAELETTLSNDVTTEVSSQLSTLTSATPLAASSTAGMTDTTRIYVNTTDGHWYWYNGSAWTDGGVYQATEDSDTVETLEADVAEIKSNWDTSSNLNDNKIEIVKRNSSDADNTITCVADDNGVLTINGSCSSDVFVMLTDEEIERFPNGDYVWLCDNKDYSNLPSNKKWLEVAFFRYGHNPYNTYRYNPVTTTTMTQNKTRQEKTLVREDVEGFTYTRDGVRFGIILNSGTYTNVKIRPWLVKKGEDETYSRFGSLKDFIGNIKSLKLKSDHNLRFVVATDIHWNHDDTANTGLNGYQKTQLLVDSINAEHHKKPLDFLLITGDIVEGGDDIALKEFKDKYLWKFEMPVVLFPGNHDPINNEKWQEITGYNRRTSLETEDFYFIFEDTFGDNLGKTWLGHWSSYYQSGDDEAYIPCNSADTGALLVGTDIQLSSVTPTMRGWNYTPKNGDYVKLAKAKDADMYKAPSLDYVQQEVAKAGDKYIVFVSHMIMGTTDGDTEGVREYLNSLDNFLFYLEGHAHIYMDYHDGTSDVWLLNSGHFFVPSGGWANVASNNYRGFRIIEIDDNKLKTYKVQPTQNVGTQYEHQYDIVEENNLFYIEKDARADVDLIKLSKDKEYSNKIAELETRLSNLENR